MADKEATVFVVDVGKSMGEKHHDRDESDLDWGMKYVWDKIATDVGTGRKTLNSAVVACRSDGTNNELDDEDGSYRHISVLQPLGQILMPNVRSLNDAIKPSSTDEGDIISAIVLAVHMIGAFCKKLKFIRKIVVVTNGTGLMDEEMLSHIAKKIRDDNIQLIVLTRKHVADILRYRGADFDDLEYGYKEEDKDETKAHNEGILRKLTDDCDGIFGTLQQAVSELGIPRVKAVRPVHSFKGHLTLGNPTQYESAMSIDVERFPSTSIATAPSASSFVMKSTMTSDESQPMANNDAADDNGLASVHNNRTYQVKDEDAPGGKRDVNAESLSKGYEYGRTAVPISASDETVTKLETKAGLEILGFVPKENYRHYMNMSKSHIIIAQRSNEKANMALSSLVNALYELDSYAVARLVVKDDKEPSIVLLAWHDLNKFEGLYEVELPFAEDVRSYKFPPLDRVVTLSGKILKEHRNLPSGAALDAMDSFVDAMDLSKYDKDDKGQPTEYLPLDENYSPMLHRLNQVIRHRAVHPNGTVPPPHDILLRPTKPPNDLLKKAAPAISQLREATDVKKVPPKALSSKRGRGARAPDVPLSGLDISALLATERPTGPTFKISADNAIPEFRQALDAATGVPACHEAVRQLGAIVEGWVKHSLGDASYGRAIEAMRVMREECVQMEEPGVYNEWVRGLREKVLGGRLGGDRREFWYGVRGVRLGLIEKRVAADSDVGEEEAREHETRRRRERYHC